jgi:nucleoside-diphosphate-sugar epimerase
MLKYNFGNPCDEVFFTRKKILITGGAGYLASGLIAQLCKIDCHIIRVDLPGALFPVVTGNALVNDIESDVTCREFWLSRLEGVDIVFHLAAYEHKHGSLLNPLLDFEVNSLSVLHMLEVCRLKNYSPRIVFASSSNIVGLPRKVPVNENFKDNPLTMYAIHKLTSEKYLHYYFCEFNTKSIVLRLSNIYGPTLNNCVNTRVVLNKVISNALKGEKLFLYRNRTCIRDFIWIDDVVAAFFAAARLGDEHANGKPYLIGNGYGCSMSEIWSMIAEKASRFTGNTITIEEDTNENLDVVEWRNFIADTSRFTEATGWIAHISLEQGIDLTIDYFMKSGRLPYE